MAIIRCKNQQVSFNKRSEELKQKAIGYGMTITSEWTTKGFNCFTARQSQEVLKRGFGVMAECGAEANGLEQGCNPSVWFLPAGGVHVVGTTFIQK